MTRTEFLAFRLREVLLNGRWIANTNYKDQIEQVTWRQATQRIGDLNTIAALVFHVNYYLVGLNQVFEGGELEIQDKYSFDMPPIESASDWQNMVEEFLVNSETFASHVEQMDENKLDEIFIDNKYGTYWRNMEAVVEHSYYHLGQISLIRKMIQSKEQMK